MADHEVLQEHGQRFRDIPGGVLPMGAPEDDTDAEPDERPPHQRRIAPFAMQITPVTVGEYAGFVTATNRRPPLYWHDPRYSQATQPVVGVSWFDAAAYAEWAGMRLPTEAEWEWTARGAAALRYPWGNRFQLARCATRNLMAGPAPVGSFPQSASPFGIEELVGNLGQWVADAYRADAYCQGAESDRACADKDSAYRVVRGGGWLLNPRTARATRRMGVWAHFREAHLGFRCARDLPQHGHV